jgi:hypothetical protein
MATYSRRLLSGSTSGKPIKVAATSIGSGTTIHAAISGSSSFDEIYLWVSNTDTSTRSITISWGDTTDPDGLICKSVSIPANSPPIPLVSGLVLNGGLSILAAGSSANVLLISGYVNRIE